MNPKTLQYLMGHSDISVTLNVYTHVGLDDARAELSRLKEVKEELRKNGKMSNLTQMPEKKVSFC